MADRMRGGSLTIFSSDRSEVYGELSDAVWEEQEGAGEKSYLISGVASDGTLEEMLRLDAAAVDHVAFDFDGAGDTFQGMAILLRPESDGKPGGALIRIETDQAPNRHSSVSLA